MANSNVNSNGMFSRGFTRFFGGFKRQWPRSLDNPPGTDLADINGLVKGDGVGNYVAAAPNVDYLTPTGDGSQLSGIPGPVYMVVCHQNGTDPPVIDREDGSLGSATPSYSSTGMYVFVLAGIDPSLHYAVISNGTSATAGWLHVRIDPGEIDIETLDVTGSLSDNILKGATILVLSKA